MLVPGIFLGMEDRIVNKDGDAFLKIRSICQEMVYGETNLVV